VYDAVAVEERHKASVTLCHKGFANDARSAGSSKGMPGIRIILENVTPGRAIMEEVEAEVKATLLGNVIAGLTKPLTPEEQSPPARQIETPARIIFRGNFKDVNHFFYKRGWTDGLPIVPPTEEAVAEMLTGTDLPPDHLLGKLLPRLGKATVEKVAINAVMAGALPTYMPVLIAGVEALLDPVAHGQGWAVSTGSWSPFWIINGPVRQDVSVNSGTGALSPGDMANAAIGRAMGLITKNIRGTRKGIEDMGTLGNPMKYSMVLAENQEESPWEPLSVEQGLKKEDSAISLFFPNCYTQVGAHGPDDKGILKAVIHNIPPGWGVTCIIIIPSQANVLANNGWTKQDIKKFVSEYARVPFYQHSLYSKQYSAFEGADKKSLPLSPEDTLKVIPNPEGLWVVVAGGAGGLIGIARGSPRFDLGGYYVNLVTKKINLPANWDSLVKKYKDIKPNYVSY
jgi:hypothetical protein